MLKVITEDRVMNNNTLNELSIETNRNRCQLREILINELLKKEFVDMEGFKTRLKIYGYSFNKEKYTLSLITIDRYLELAKSHMFIDDTRLIKFVIINIIEEILNRNGIGKVFPKGENEYIIIYNYNFTLKYSVTDKIHSVSKEIQSCIMKALRYTSTVYIGTQVNSLSEIYKSYYDILAMVDERFYSQDGMIFINSKKVYNKGAFNSNYILYFIKEFEHCLGELNIELLTELMNAFFEKAIMERIIVSEVKKVIEIALMSLISTLEKNGCMYKQIIHENYMKMINNIISVSELKGVFNNYLVNAVKIIEKKAAFYSTPAVRKTIQYISLHLHEDINLDSMASYLKMNSSYFSRYFKRKTGVNFVGFLTNIRIEKAKELLLETELSIDEISVRVGHVNKSYFAKVFKKVTGLNPGEFRKKLHA